MWKYAAAKMWSLNLGMALLPVVLMAGCGYTAPATLTLTPTLTSIAPSSGTQGAAVAVTLTGTYFASGSTIGLSGTGVTISNTTVVSSTSITATFTIAANATVAAQNVTVTNATGTSGPQTFTVILFAATVSSTTPANGSTGVLINDKIIASLNKPLTSGNITTATFIVSGGGNSVAGVVACDATCTNAIFAPVANLAANTTFTATITAAAGLASNYVWTFTTGAGLDATAPIVSSTNPASAATLVALNQKINASFSKAMDSRTITATTFTVKQGATPVAGTVSYVGTNATFTPTANLTASLVYTATIATGATDLAGNALVGGGAPNPWNFTTGTTSNTSAPTVTLTVPLNAATGVGINQTINATFSTGMDPSTINSGTFTVAGPGITAVTGTVIYNGTSNIATFTPSINLATNATFTATITTGAKDLSSNPLAANKVWTFTTGATTTGPGPVNLGSAGTFAGAMGGSAGLTNQGINSVVNGDIGTAGASTTVTGFHDTTIPYNPPAGCIYTETPLNVGVVNGTIYTATPPPTTTCPNEGTALTFAIATHALMDAQTAYNTLAGMPAGADPGGQLGGLTLAPAVYKTGGGAFLITGSDLTLDAKGDANAVWVFQMATTLTVGAPGAPRSIILINGAQAKNVYWQVGSSATINAAGGGTMVGTIIASAAVTFSTAGNAAITTLNGRAMALNASLTMVNTVINVPAP